MKKENISNITVNSIKGIPKGKTDWERIDAMKEKEALQNAKIDPDAQPLSSNKNLQQTIDVKLIRSKLSMTQEQFASTFHLSLPTLRDWEQNRVRPDQAARTLLRVIERNPAAVKMALVSA